MSSLSKEQAASRERTLLAALLLSAWAPLATGIAVITSRSTTQLADFVRRTVELAALFVSWWVFRHGERRPELAPEPRARMELAAGLSVAAALGFSGIVMLAVGLSRIRTFVPGGNVYPGLAIALLGLLTNVWFWRRYTKLGRERYNAVIDAQRGLYGAKAAADLCVLTALTAVAAAPGHPATRYVDVLGSVALAAYLVWSGIRTARTQLEAGMLERHRSRP